MAVQDQFRPRARQHGLKRGPVGQRLAIRHDPVRDRVMDQDDPAKTRLLRRRQLGLQPRDLIGPKLPLGQMQRRRDGRTQVQDGHRAASPDEGKAVAFITEPGPPGGESCRVRGSDKGVVIAGRDRDIGGGAQRA